MSKRRAATSGLEIKRWEDKPDDKSATPCTFCRKRVRHGMPLYHVIHKHRINGEDRWGWPLCEPCRDAIAGYEREAVK